MNICDCELVSDFTWIRGKKIVLYGAGYWGKRVFYILHGMGIGVAHVVATTARKGEMFTNGIKVEQVSVVAPQINHPDYLVIICSHQYREEMLAHLEALGFGMEGGAKICRLRAFATALLVNEKGTDSSPQPARLHESARKIDLYKEMHHNSQYGIGTVHWLPIISLFIDYLAPKIILDYGCGKGLLVDVLKKRYPMIESHGFDPAVPGYDKLNLGSADYLFCADVLEHIPEDDLPTAIQTIRSISENVMFVLHHAAAGAILPNGENAHCTIKPITWYYRLFRRYFSRLVCLPVDHVRSVVITFDVPQDVVDAYMRVLESDLFF